MSANAMQRMLKHSRPLLVARTTQHSAQRSMTSMSLAAPRCLDALRNSNFGREYPTNKHARCFSDESAKKNVDEESVTDDAEETAAHDEEETAAHDEEEPVPSGDDVEEVSKEEMMEKEITSLKDQLLRSLAEQENIRQIAKRDVASAHSFAVSSFAKSLLETSDNLERALDVVPEEMRADKTNHSVLATLYEGIQMTQVGLEKAFEKNGLLKFGKAGDDFDPNLHSALYEYVDPNVEEGKVGQIIKKGFMLNKRVLRPAEVGVVKKA